MIVSRRFLSMLAAVVLALPALCARAAEEPVAPPLTPDAAVTRDGRSADYLVGPYDLLEITVFQVEDLSRTVRVNARGTFSLPMVGQVDAAGHTASEIESVVAANLAECCLQDPQVSIFIKEYVSQRVTVEGEVSKPGIYPLTGPTTLLQAIAMASGTGQLAEDEVRIFRGTPDGIKQGFLYDLDAIRAGKVSDPVIQGNDIVVVGKSGTRSVIKSITDTLRGFIGFGTL